MGISTLHLLEVSAALLRFDRIDMLTYILYRARRGFKRGGLGLNFKISDMVLDAFLF